MRMRMFPDMPLRDSPKRKVLTKHSKAKSANRVPTNVTLDPTLKAWAIEHAETRYGESLSALVERLIRGEQARANDRIRKAA